MNRLANVRNFVARAPCALSAKHYYKERVANAVLASLAYHIFDDYWTCSVLVKIYKKFVGFNPSMAHIPSRYGLD